VASMATGPRQPIPTVDPPAAALGDPSLFLDVDMDELPGTLPWADEADNPSMRERRWAISL
jgi:hypothetical protein